MRNEVLNELKRQTKAGNPQRVRKLMTSEEVHDNIGKICEKTIPSIFH